MIERSILKKVRTHIEDPEAVVITGMRRVGKTTLLHQVADGLPSANRLFLDLENPINQKYFAVEDYEAIAGTFASLGVALRERSYIFLDEIQNVRTLPSVVKYLSDHYPMKFFLTGSASFYLKNLFTESLAGRKRIFELFPLDFSEFLALKGERLRVPQEPVITAALHATFARRYEEYVTYGGFPGVVAKTTDAEKRAALEEIFSSYFQKEVLQLGDFRRNDVIRDLLLLLFARIGSRVEIQRLTAELGVTRPTLLDYLAFLEGTYIVTLVRPFSRSRDVEIRRAPKVYAVDSGLASQLARVDFGRAFENAVFHQLRVAGGAVRYYQQKTGAEIDFIVERDGRHSAFEVKERATRADAATLVRRASALDIPDATLISAKFAPDVAVRYGFQL